MTVQKYMCINYKPQNRIKHLPISHFGEIHVPNEGRCYFLKVMQ